jgi:hypothetical protein
MVVVLASPPFPSVLPLVLLDASASLKDAAPDDVAFVVTPPSVLATLAPPTPTLLAPVPPASVVAPDSLKKSSSLAAEQPSANRSRVDENPWKRVMSELHDDALSDRVQRPIYYHYDS